MLCDLVPNDTPGTGYNYEEFFATWNLFHSVVAPQVGVEWSCRPIHLLPRTKREVSQWQGGQAEQKSHVHANPCTPFPKRETFGTTPSPLHRLLSCLDLPCSGSAQKAVLIFYCLDVLARWNKGIFGTGHHQDLMVGHLVGTCAMDAAFLLFARAGDDDLSSCSSRICCCC